MGFSTRIKPILAHRLGWTLVLCWASFLLGLSTWKFIALSDARRFLSVGKDQYIVSGGILETPVLNMTVAIPIAGSSGQIPQLKALLSSLIMTKSARSPSFLNVVIITDNEEILATWEAWKKVLVSSCIGMSVIRVPQDSQNGDNPWATFLNQTGGRYNTKHYGFYGAKWKLFMHKLFEGTEIDEVVALDVDQVFLRSVEELWLEFNEMRKTGAGLGITCLSVKNKPVSYGLDGGRTLCTSSVILYRRTRLKEVGYSEKLVAVMRAKQGDDPRFIWHDGDQLLFNVFMQKHPELSYRVDCSWNCVYSRFGDAHERGEMPEGCQERTCGLVHYNRFLQNYHIHQERNRRASSPPKFLLDFGDGYRRLPLRFLGTRSSICAAPGLRPVDRFS